MDMPVNVSVDDPNADTEWNDILRKHKIIPEKPPSPTPIIQEALLEAQLRAHENRLEDKDLDDLDELEDEEDEAFLHKYRDQRLAELSAVSRASVHNQVYPLQKPDYSRDVTEASKKSYVLVHLTSSLGTNVESRLVTEMWRMLARQFGDVKFCELKADMCIEGYPERNTPTILIYKDGDIKKQIVTLRELRGSQSTLKGWESRACGTVGSSEKMIWADETADFEEILKAVGAIGPNDSRLTKVVNQDSGHSYNGIRSGKTLIDPESHGDPDGWD